MTVLLYIDAWREDEARLAELMRQTVPGVEWETCRDLQHLAKMISRPGQEWAVVVAAAGQPSTLRQLAAFRDQLSRLGLLLILPSQEQSLLALGHGLAPRLLVGGADAPQLIAQVLKRMVRNRRPRAGSAPGERWE